VGRIVADAAAALFETSRLPTRNRSQRAILREGLSCRFAYKMKRPPTCASLAGATPARPTTRSMPDQ
jgi:hypothetical protein